MAEYMYPPYVQTDGTIMRHYVCEDEGERDALGNVPAACTAYVKSDDAFYIRQTNGTWVAPGGAGGPHDHDGVYATEGHTHQGGGGEAFPVGSVFISVVSTDPATLLGYGTWAAFGAGRLLVGQSSGDVDFDTAKETGGAKTATLQTTNLPAHNHAITDPGHAHNQQRHGTTTGALSGVTTAPDTSSSSPAALGPNTASATTGITTQNTGSGTAFSILPPYIVVYMWERVS